MNKLTLTTDLRALGKIETDTIETATTNDLTISNNVVMTSDLRVNGEIYLNSFTKIYTPFQYAGKIDGANLNIMKSAGRKTFTVERASGYATGVFKIIFAEPMPDTNYIVIMTPQRWANFAITWNTRPPTVNDFHAVIYTTSNALADSIFHFTVMYCVCSRC